MTHPQVFPISLRGKFILSKPRPRALVSSLTLLFHSHSTSFVAEILSAIATKQYPELNHFSPSPHHCHAGPNIITSFLDYCSNWSLLLVLLHSAYPQHGSHNNLAKTCYNSSRSSAKTLQNLLHITQSQNFPMSYNDLFGHILHDLTLSSTSLFLTHLTAVQGPCCSLNTTGTLLLYGLALDVPSISNALAQDT